MPDTPPEPGPIHLLGSIAEAIDGAFDRGLPVAVAYVDGASRPQLSLRGTVQVLNDTELALWARSTGMPEGVTANPNVSLVYHDIAHVTFYLFTGRARVETDAAIRERVFSHSPEREQAHDPHRNGTALVIEVDTVHGRGPDGRVLMARAQA